MTPEVGFGTPPRRFPRQHVDERVRCTVERAGQTIEIRGRCATIGLGGAGLTLAGELVMGERLTVEFKFPPSGEPLLLHGRVANKHGFQHGIEFVGVSAAQTRKLKQLLELLPAE